MAEASKPRTIDRQTYNLLPEFLLVRECCIHIGRPGFRTKLLILATTLLDPMQYTKKDLAELYRQRWNAELDLRSLKRTLHMDVLRCKTPELVRKELWTHLLAYNLIRTIMAQAASQHGIKPRTLSFQSAVRTLEAFQPVIALQGQHCAAFRSQLYQELLDAIAIHRVADRPNRYEPRLRKKAKTLCLPQETTRGNETSDAEKLWTELSAIRHIDRCCSCYRTIFLT